MVIYLMEQIGSGKRLQISKSKLEELKETLSKIISILDKDISPELQMKIEDLYTALSLAENLDITMLPDSVKSSIEKGLKGIKTDVAELAFGHFTFNDFEPTEEIIPIMRHVVAEHYGGVEID